MSIYRTSIVGAVVLMSLTSAARADEPLVTRLTKTHFSKFFLRYSPSGSHIAYSRHYANRRAANQILVGLHLVKADGSDDRRLLAEFDREVQIQEHPSWSPDGKRLVISGGGNDIDITDHCVLRRVAGVVASARDDQPLAVRRP